MRKRFSGFTMIELVLCISLAGILVISLLIFSDIGTVSFKSASEKLKHDIRHAQWKAMNDKKRYGVVFNPGAETYSVYQGVTSNIIADPLNPSDKLTVDYTADKKFRDVEITSVDINGTTQVEFDGRGFPYDGNNNLLTTPGTITLSHDGTPLQIIIEPNTGRVGEQ